MPLLATNMRGAFVPTRRNVEGMAPCGFTHCPPGQEGPLLNELHRALWQLATSEGWSNRCTSVPDAVERLRQLGVEPKSLVISEAFLSDILGADFDLDAAKQAMDFQGYVSVVEGMQVLLSGLPLGSAIVAGPPATMGLYTRIGDHLGLLLQRVNRSLVLVRSNVA